MTSVARGPGREGRPKYPRTPHLPWSPAVAADDVRLDLLPAWDGERVIQSVKMDGENTTIWAGGSYARSPDGRTSPAQTWTRRLAAQIGPQLPAGWRVCGESLVATWPHRLVYRHQPPFAFYVFSLWDAETCLDWDTTLEWCALLDLVPVPVLYDGIWDAARVQGEDTRTTYAGDPVEGYVVRLARAFRYTDFGASCAKYVRAGLPPPGALWPGRR